jgi:hypothetical protein
MKIFILDDDQNRHEAIVKKYPGNYFRHAYNVPQACSLLAEGNYDAAFLDHDLCDWYKAEAEDAVPVERTGLDVVRYLLEKIPRERWPKQVIVHTWNGSRGRLMTALLAEQGIDVSYVPFTP